MREELRKQYDSLPHMTRGRITSIELLCDIFLSNKVTISKVQTVMTVRPTASKGTLESELAVGRKVITVCTLDMVTLLLEKISQRSSIDVILSLVV
jgi:hypothetical protein